MTDTTAYRALLQNQLVPQLDDLASRIAKLEAEIGEYRELRATIAVLQSQQQQGAAAAQQHPDTRAARAQLKALGGAVAEAVSKPKAPAPAPIKTLVDLGAGVYCRARVPDTRRICVHIGCGVHPELTLAEALDAAAAREGLLGARAAALKERHLAVSGDVDLARFAVEQLEAGGAGGGQ